jgi:hypothetical protein
LDLCVERFAARIGDAVAQIGDYVFEAAFEHPRHALDRFKTAALRGLQRSRLRTCRAASAYPDWPRGHERERCVSAGLPTVQ